MSYHWLLFTIMLIIESCSAATVIVNVNSGTIFGTSEKSETQRYKLIERYLGIPYAQAPVGDLRFALPKPYETFPNRTLFADNSGAKCPQFYGTDIIGEEDCLFLDVYVPKPRYYWASTQPKSVMVWIHGGAFHKGAGNNFDPQVLALKEDVIVVTMNYRLGALGFLAKRGSRLSGNYALWDQKLAIHWVKDNIAQFGGNPNSITLFGQSAGAFMITYQMVSHLNNASVFQRAITQSGSALYLRYLATDPDPLANVVIEGVGCSEEDYLTCLRTKSIQEILGATVTRTGLLSFNPIIDNHFLKADIVTQIGSFIENGFNSELTGDLGSFGDYDLLSGWNDQEGLFYMEGFNQLNLHLTGKNISNGVSAQILNTALLAASGGTGNKIAQTVVDVLINYYMNNPWPLTSIGRTADERRIEIFSAVAGDVAFKVPTIQHLQLHSLLSNKKTYAYEFTHKGRYQRRWYEGPEWLRTGANHEDEIPYVFGYPFLAEERCQEVLRVPKCDFNSDERRLSTKIMDMWANFAKNRRSRWHYRENFKYPHGQKYTVLNGEGVSTKTHPLGDRLRVITATDNAVLQHNKRAVATAAAPAK